jgi:predicted HAD superfamily Cof-like phosphohydrolase
MRVSQEKVGAFHDKHAYANAEKPTLITGPEADVRYKVMREELEEYMRAQDRGDLVEVADAIADLLYTVLGTAVVHGIDMQPIFDEVHRSNMTKDAAPPNEPNRPFKGAAFERPRIAELLMIQSTGLREAGHGV